MNRTSILLLGLGTFITSAMIRVKLAEVSADVEGEVGIFLTVIGPVLLAFGSTVAVWSSNLSYRSVGAAVFLNLVFLSICTSFTLMLWHEAGKRLTIIPETIGACAVILFVIMYRDDA